jgi:hypothetical protein
MDEAQNAVAQVVGRNEKAIRPHAMILLAIVVFGIVAATHALAAGRGASGSGPQGSHASTGFQGSPVTAVPTMPAPILNPSVSYTIPQSPEVPVSPGSPGSIFGNH